MNGQPASKSLATIPETSTTPGQTIDEAYYTNSIKIVWLRVLPSGVRISGELNKLLNSQPIAKRIQLPVCSAIPDKTGKPVVIKLFETKNSTGKLITVIGKVYRSKDIGSTIWSTWAQLYPRQQLTFALKGAAKALASKIDGDNITIESTVIDYIGKPEIILQTQQRLHFR